MYLQSPTQEAQAHILWDALGNTRLNAKWYWEWIHEQESIYEEPTNGRIYKNIVLLEREVSNALVERFAEKLSITWLLPQSPIVVKINS